MIACALDRLGAVVVPLTTMFREREIGHVVAATDMKLLFVPGQYRSCDHDLLALSVKDAAPNLCAWFLFQRNRLPTSIRCRT